MSSYNKNRMSLVLPSTISVSQTPIGYGPRAHLNLCHLCLSVFICAVHLCHSYLNLKTKNKCLQSTTSFMVSPNSHAHRQIGQHGERMLRSSSNPRTFSVWSMAVPLHLLTPPNKCCGRSETSTHMPLFTYLSAPTKATSLRKLHLDPTHGLS